MSGPARIVSEAAQSFSFSRRAMLVGGSQAALGLVLAGRMGWLSIAENERYALLADSNRVNITLIPPRRGWIVDRHGAPIASNRTDFRVDLIPDRIEDKERVVGQLRDLLALTPDDVERIMEDLDGASGFQPVPVKENLDWERFAAVSVRLPELPGVSPTRGFARYYPAGAAVGHLVGYVGAATREQYLETKNPLMNTPGFKLGKDGIEKVLEDKLQGVPGAKRVEVTARGRLVRELDTRPDQQGGTIKLTIDAGLQEYAARRLGNESGSVVVIDCLTGGIVALASMPAYDPNDFSDGISTNEWAMLSENDHLPLTNKALQGLYPPGSTLKPTNAMAIQAAGVDPTRVVNCPGGYTLGNRRFGCLGRHGPMTMHTAIARSCNTYFYALGREIGIERLADAARKLGFGADYDIPMPSQRYGTVPDSAWKMRRFDQAWTQADTLNASIGQGYFLASPFQLALSTARIASGRALVPHMIAGQVGAAAALAFPPEHLAVVRAGMDEVVNGAGTAVRSKLPFPDLRMGGKTGTAQVRRLSGMARGGRNVPWKYRDHGLFVGFAPVDAPRYAIAVVIEHGMSGSGAAAPVARDCMTFLFDRNKAMDVLAPMEKEWGGTISERMATEQAVFLAQKQAVAAGLVPAETPIADGTPTPAPSPGISPAAAPE